jgi:hypothetical protein
LAPERPPKVIVVAEAPPAKISEAAKTAAPKSSLVALIVPSLQGMLTLSWRKIRAITTLRGISIR